jgi:hypothetical protein
MGEMTLHFYVTLPVSPDFYSGTEAEDAEILKKKLTAYFMPVCTVATVVKTMRIC